MFDGQLGSKKTGRTAYLRAGTNSDTLRLRYCAITGDMAYDNRK